jgi:hypothetical protein
MRSACLLVVLAAACGDGASTFTAQPDAPVTVTGPDAPVAALPDGPAAWVTLAGTDWTLKALTETYLCVRVTADRDLYIGGFDPIAPVGTHHTVLGISAAGSPDGVTTCNGFLIEPQILFGSGVGTERLMLPPGVAVKVSKGQQIMLNLHLFNTSDAPLSGTSGVRALLVDASALTDQAEALLAGPVGFTIPEGPAMIDGTCTMARASTIFAVGPHMHKLGVHMTARLGTAMLLDRDYTFDEQTFAPVNVQAKPGDRITTECTYDNDTGGPVHFGQSTNDEMCFLIVYHYPSGGQFSVCSL